MPVGELPDITAGLPGGFDPGLVDAALAPVIDHHVHVSYGGSVSRGTFEEALNEGSPDAIPQYMSMFDGPLGVAIRRWCAPALGLTRHVSGDEYWNHRSTMTEDQVGAALLGSAGVDRWLIDTGFSPEPVCDRSTFSRWSGAPTSEVVRLETTAERLLRNEIGSADFPDALRHELQTAGPDVVGFKSIAAYRCGFDIDWQAPSDADVIAEIDRLRIAAAAPGVRLASPLVASFLVHAAVDVGRPIQFHVGYGDRDLDLQRTDPLLLLPLLRQKEVAEVAVCLLHCYPYHRQAGYLAQSFNNVYFDVGLAVNFVGARAVDVVGESLELAPFAKQLFSSDACGPPELHFLGSILWRRAMLRTLQRWVDSDEISAVDAARYLTMIGTDNARRVYRL